MFRRRVWFSIFPLLCLATGVFAQGKAGGYGQGSAGGYGQNAPPSGAFGGGQSGGGFDSGSNNKYERPDEEEVANLWESKTAILTPGDRVEIKFKVRKGETLFAGATSDAFDPALSIEDAKGTVLFKNDDRADGDQAPFVAYRFAEEGTYTLKVLSYRSVSGGKFTVKYRTFVAADAGLGLVRHDKVPAISLESSRRVAFRLRGSKDRIYDLRQVVGHAPTGNVSARLLRLVGPTGVQDSDYEWVRTSDGMYVFQAKVDGDFYIEYLAYGVDQFSTDFNEVAVVSAKATSEHTLDLAKGEIKIVEFPIVPDQIIRTTFSGGPTAFLLSAPNGEGLRGDATAEQTFGNHPGWLWFKLNYDSEYDVVRVFHGKGVARMSFRSLATHPIKVQFKNTESLPTWTTGDAMKGAIQIGDSKLFLIKSTKSELMRVNVQATHFQPRLDIFRLSGERANSLSDRTTHTAADDLYFPDEGTFLVRLSCDGHGGSGEYTMKRDSLTPTPYKLGTAQTMKLEPGNFGLYSVDLEAGKRYQLMTDNPANYLRADLLDDDGQFLVSQRIRFDNVEVQYFIPTRSGRHRLWLRSGPGVRNFKLELHVPPKIGG